MARKYDELLDALEVWNRTVLEYDERSVEVAKTIIEGLEDFLGLQKGAIYWLRPGETADDLESINKARVPFATGSRYVTENDTWGFTPALLIRNIERPDLAPHLFRIRLEILLRAPLQPVTFKLLDETFELANSEPQTLLPVYEYALTYMKEALITASIPVKRWSGPVN